LKVYALKSIIEDFKITIAGLRSDVLLFFIERKYILKKKSIQSKISSRLLAADDIHTHV